MPILPTARAGLPALYRHYRNEGLCPRTARSLARGVIEADRWLNAKHGSAWASNSYGGRDVYTWRGVDLPEGEVRDGLVALDPDLSRWTVRVTACPDWDFAEGAEDEARNAGIGVWWSDEDPDIAAARVGESWADSDYGDDDPRPEGGRVHYADTGLTRGGRYSRETLYLYSPSEDARRFFVPTGTPRGLVDLVAKERAGASVEAFAQYLGGKYDECGGVAPLLLHVEILWDDEVFGEASCGGYDPNPDAPDNVVSALVDSDLLGEALYEARDRVRRVIDDAIEAATLAADRATEALERLRDDRAAGSLRRRKFPAAAYPKEG
jgi:hypothetical protein